MIEEIEGNESRHATESEREGNGKKKSNKEGESINDILLREREHISNKDGQKVFLAARPFCLSLSLSGSLSFSLRVSLCDTVQHGS